MLSRIDGAFLALDTEHGIYREPYLAVRKASKNDRSSSDLGRSPQLSLRAALDHDGLKAPPTLPVDPRKATYCPPHVYRVGTSVTRF